MYIRKKKRKNCTAIQIVESRRINGKPRQKVLKHIGTAKTEKEIDDLIKAAGYILHQLESKGQASLFSFEESDIKLDNNSNKEYNVNIYNIEEEGRIIKGINDIYGEMYEQIGFDKIFGTKQKTKNYAKVLKQITLARIATPKSKRASVEMLDKDYGIQINLQAVYDMMGNLDEKKINQIQDISFNYTKSVLKEKINVLFLDGTTLYFESQEEDGFREKGYSKDGKFNEVQVCLTLLVTESGLPVGYKLYNGKHYEGNSLKDLIEEVEKKYEIDKVILVADSGFLSKENIDYLEKKGNKYILGARIKNTTKELKEQILDKSNYTVTEIDENGNMVNGYIELDYNKGKRMIVTYSKKRAIKDKKDREKNIKKLLEKEGKNTKELISNFGYKKFVKMVGDSKIEIDEEKIKEAEQWDGLHGIITNDNKTKVNELIEYYRGLWQVEESFRINKHDLLIRPIFHWTEQKIKAHIAIAFIAFVLVRHLEHRLKLHGYNYSAEIIRRELLRVQGSIIFDKTNPKKKWFLPSNISGIGQSIYKVMGKKWIRTVQDIV